MTEELKKNVVYKITAADESGVSYWWIPDNPKKDLGVIKVTYHGGLKP
jgi:hypothetical protein